MFSFINDRRNGKVDDTPAIRIEDLDCSVRSSQARRLRAGAIIMIRTMRLA